MMSNLIHCKKSENTIFNLLFLPSLSFSSFFFFFVFFFFLFWVSSVNMDVSFELPSMQSTWTVKGTYLTVSTVCNNPVILITIVNCRNFVVKQIQESLELFTAINILWPLHNIGHWPNQPTTMFWQGCVGYTVQLWDYKTLLTMITHIALHATNGVMWWWGSKWWSCRSLMDRSINAAQK